jgi:hypothetical protein
MIQLFYLQLSIFWSRFEVSSSYTSKVIIFVIKMFKHEFCLPSIEGGSFCTLVRRICLFHSFDSDSDNDMEFEGFQEDWTQNNFASQLPSRFKLIGGATVQHTEEAEAHHYYELHVLIMSLHKCRSFISLFGYKIHNYCDV